MLTYPTNPQGILYRNQDTEFKNSQNLSKYFLFVSFSANANPLIFHKLFAFCWPNGREKQHAKAFLSPTNLMI